MIMGFLKEVLPRSSVQAAAAHLLPNPSVCSRPYGCERAPKELDAPFFDLFFELPLEA